MSKRIEVKPIQKSKQKKSLKDIESYPEVVNRFQKPTEEQINPNHSKRRLKKLHEINESEDLIDDIQEQENYLIEEPYNSKSKQQYHQFKIADDEQLQREKQDAEKAKMQKKLKGNQQIDKFIDKNKSQISSKKNKQKTAKAGTQVQMTIDEMLNIKNQKKKKRKNSSDFFISDHAEISEQQEKLIEQKRLEAYAVQYNGTMEDQNKLIQRAKKLSLAATSDKKQSLDEYEYHHDSKQVQDKKPNDKLLKQKKPESQNEVKKQAKNRNKVEKQAKQIKSGDLSGYIIALTGEFEDYTKDELIEILEQLGADCPKALTKKCNLLIQGAFVLDGFKRKIANNAKDTKKSKDAIARGIQIIPYQQIDQFFQEKTRKTLQEHLEKNKPLPQMNHLYDLLNKKIDEFIDHKIQSAKKKDIMETNQNHFNHKQTPFPQNNFINKQKQKQNTGNDPWTVLWTDKYKPNSLNDVIGQTSQIKSLRQWIQSWEDVQFRGNKRQVKDSKSFLPTGNINSKAALLSGDPGLGKTTTARLLAMQFNYGVVEYNASDIRNKSGVNLMESNSYSLNTNKVLQKTIIIMDEVDGMSSGDRGGIASIINMIKNTKVPIICICNDRSAEKIRSLAGHCYDIKFHKPNKNLIVKRLKQIISKEGGVGEDRALQRLVQTFQNDMRQLLSYLQVVFQTISKHITLKALNSSEQHSKDSSVMINHYDASRKLMNKAQFYRMSLNDRLNCFFIDSDLVPLMIHQNILSSAKKGKINSEQFHSIVKGLKGFVVGDMLDRNIRKSQQWGLMPSYGFLSCIYTTQKISQSLGFPAFPSWLGKNSTERKNRRLVKQIKNHILPVSFCANSKIVKEGYVISIFNEIVQLLKQQDVERVLQFMEIYNINPTILNEHLISLQFNPSKSNLLAGVETATKSKLTRLYNKRHEEAKLKAAKGPKAKVEHVKFDPVLEEVQDLVIEDEQQDTQKQKDQDLLKKTNKQNKKKGKR